MEIPESTRQRMYENIGNKTDGFLQRVDGCIDKYTNVWQLSDLSYMPTDTINLIFSCESELYGSCVLKICVPDLDVTAEINCLRTYNDNGYCKLWAYDLSDNILLLERIIPGSQMWEIDDYKERARLMAITIKGLPIIYNGHEQYPTYLSRLERSRNNLTKIGGLEDLLFYVDEAMAIYAELKKRHNKACLLHGDLHHENMLLNSNDRYTIIDPQGIIDDPVMETARFMMNEMEKPHNENKFREIAAIISSITNISEKDILKSMYVDAVIMNDLGGYYPTQEAFEEEKRSALEACKFVYGLLN